MLPVVFGARCTAAFLLLAMAGCHQRRIPAPPPSADFVAMQNRLLLAVGEFHVVWQRAWRESELYRRGTFDNETMQQRQAHLHCHFEVPRGMVTNASGREYRAGPDPQFSLIRSRHSAFSTCPSWLLSPTIRDAADETTWRDGAVMAAFRPRIVQARQHLLTALDSAALMYPQNDWIVGQRVRFRLDARDADGAGRVVDDCNANAWWCAALAGLVHARRGDVIASDQLFTKMRGLMPDSTRCKWSDISNLLPPKERDGYSWMKCAARDSLHAQLWWLSDPLFRIAANDRLVEQEVRRVEIALRQATLQDERYSFDAERGGDAITTMLERYGWPSYTSWGSPTNDLSHDGYIRFSHNSPRTPPYTSFEYTLGRTHAVPGWEAVASPFDAIASDWNISGDDSDGQPSFLWWPEEHYKPLRRLVQLPDGQTAFLRRQERIEVASALRLTHPALQATRDRFDVMLLSTLGPANVDSLDQQHALAGSAVVLRGLTKPGPALLAIEALGTGDDLIDARTRFAIAPPPTLAAMQPREIALSDPLLITARTDAERRAAPTDSLVSLMLPTVKLDSRTRRVGVYWESYGVGPTDSATIAVRLATVIAPSIARRIGMAAKITSNPNSSIEVTWKEPDITRSTTTLHGPVTVQIRTLQLDLAQLAAGSYLLEVHIRLQDGRSARSQRFIGIVQ